MFAATTSGAICALCVTSIAIAENSTRPKERPSGVFWALDDPRSPKMPILPVWSHAPAAPLTDVELLRLRNMVAQCWNVSDQVSRSKTAVVTVRFSMNMQGRPHLGSFELIGAGKDTSEVVKSAYSAARRAIIRCGANGYKLPLEKYDQWRNIELTFNPERMSLR